MSALNNSLLLGQEGGGGGGYAISRSLRFSSADSSFLSRTPASAGNRKTWTWAGWVKRSALGTYQYIWGNANSSAENGFMLRFENTDTIRIADWTNTAVWQKITTQVFRDVSAWYHIVISYDTTNGTAADRVRFYVNGSRVTTFSTNTDPTQNYDGYTNNTSATSIGRWGAQADYYLNGYLADIHFIDGQALDPTSFGEFSATTGVWMPKAYTGTYGTNGFHLDFSDNSTAAALGTDTSGNGNTWTPNNFQVTSVDATAGVQSGITSAPINGSPYGNPTQWFDGNLATSAGVDGGSSNTTPRKWTFNTPVPYSSSVRLRISTNEPNMGYHFNNVNTGLPNNGSTPTWYTVAAGSGSMSNVGVYNSNGSSQGTIHISAIEVDGSLLIATPPQGNDSLVDVPTNGSEVDTGSGGQVRGNYCTWNPLAKNGIYNSTLSNGNLDSAASGDARTAWGTIAIPASGKWYFEVTTTGSPSGPYVGVAQYTGVSNAYPQDSYGPSVTYAGFSGNKDITGTYSSYGATYSNATIGVAVNVDASEITFYKDGVSQGVISQSVVGGFPFVSTSGGSGTFTLNAGQRPFAYTAPSGFKALCTANLPAPVVTKPSTVMDVKLYTGNGSTQTISGLGFSPDLVWMKSRSGAYIHGLFDTVRGAGKGLTSNNTDAEITYAAATSFNSDGFTNGADFNSNLDTYAAWCWDAGSSTVTNTAGSISSQVRANASAGFSIVTYTGTGSNGTVGHGLGIAPSFYVVKARSVSGESWIVYHSGAGMKFGVLNAANAFDSNTSTIWNNTAASSTVFSLGNNTAVNGNGTTYVSYLFAPVAGYSSFGSYTGNGSTDGPFVYTGFRPRWILIKESSASGNNWNIWDAARDDYNVTTKQLKASSSDAEGTNTFADFTSNGFKIRVSTSGINTSSATYIYAAFAESPFQYARAR